MHSRHKVVIAGCGDVACRMAARLPRNAWQVFGLRRDVGSLPAGIEPIEGDLQDKQRPQQWPTGDIDYLVYAASASNHDAAGYQAAYVDGLRHVLSWLHESGQRPRRLLFLSSTGVYGQNQGEWVDENSATEPTGFTGQIMLQAEQLALSSGIASTAVRLAGLYHPARPWLQDQVRSGALAPRDPPLYSNRIHRDDAGGLIALLLQTDAAGQALQDCYLAVDDEPAPLHEVFDWMREQLGVRGDSGAVISRRAGSKRCSNARARALGWAPQYKDYREGYAGIGTDT